MYWVMNRLFGWNKDVWDDRKIQAKIIASFIFFVIFCVVPWVYGFIYLYVYKLFNIPW